MHLISASSRDHSQANGHYSCPRRDKNRRRSPSPRRDRNREGDRGGRRDDRRDDSRRRDDRDRCATACALPVNAHAHALDSAATIFVTLLASQEPPPSPEDAQRSPPRHRNKLPQTPTNTHALTPALLLREPRRDRPRHSGSPDRRRRSRSPPRRGDFPPPPPRGDFPGPPPRPGPSGARADTSQSGDLGDASVARELPGQCAREGPAASAMRRDVTVSYSVLTCPALIRVQFPQARATTAASLATSPGNVRTSLPAADPEEDAAADREDAAAAAGGSATSAGSSATRPETARARGVARRACHLSCPPTPTRQTRRESSVDLFRLFPPRNRRAVAGGSSGVVRRTRRSLLR